MLHVPRWVAPSRRQFLTRATGLTAGASALSLLAPQRANAQAGVPLMGLSDNTNPQYDPNLTCGKTVGTRTPQISSLIRLRPQRLLRFNRCSTSRSRREAAFSTARFKVGSTRHLRVVHLRIAASNFPRTAIRFCIRESPTPTSQPGSTAKRGCAGVVVLPISPMGRSS
jgi:hypothetical protein